MHRLSSIQGYLPNLPVTLYLLLHYFSLLLLKVSPSGGSQSLWIFEPSTQLPRTIPMMCTVQQNHADFWDIRFFVPLFFFLQIFLVQSIEVRSTCLLYDMTKTFLSIRLILFTLVSFPLIHYWTHKALFWKFSRWNKFKV